MALTGARRSRGMRRLVPGDLRGLCERQVSRGGGMKQSLEELVRVALAEMQAPRRIACIRLPLPPGGGPPPGPEARAALAGALLRAAPRVTPVREHPRALWADAGGMQRRGGDAAVAGALLAAPREAGFPAPEGDAGTCNPPAAGTRERRKPGRAVPPSADTL